MYRNEYKHNLTGRMDDPIPYILEVTSKETVAIQAFACIRYLKKETFPFSCSSMGLGLCKDGHDRYTYSCVVMRKAKRRMNSRH